MQIKNKLITGGVNPIYNCLAVKEEAVFFGCSNQIFVYDMFNQNKIIQTLNFHKKRLNTIKFIEKSDNYYLLSGAADGYVALWENTSKNIFDINYKVVQQLKLTGSIAFITTRYINNQNYLLVGDTEGLVQLYTFTESATEKLQKIDEIRFPEKSIIEAADLHLLPQTSSTKLVIALGSLDRHIHLYTLQLKSNSQEEEEKTITNKLTYKLSLQGHNDAITALNFKTLKNKNQQQYLLLASASKQHHIRVFKVQLKCEIQEQIDNFDKKTSFVLDKEYYVSLDSILKSHTDHVISLEWGLHNLENGDLENENDVALISASFDFSIIIWILEDNIWVCKARLGQISGNKHAFFNAQFSSDYKHVISYTYSGALNVWKRANLKDFKYDTINTITGHISYVTDLDWDSGNNLIVTSSQDQTSRVFGENKDSNIWHEFSRSQIHGYDINSIKFLPLQDKAKEENKDKDYCDLIVCGADEKVLRLLEPPAHFINFVNSQSKQNLRLYIPNHEEEKQVINQQATDSTGYLQYKTQTEGGLQVLGLMTKNVVIREKVGDYHDYTQYDGEDNSQQTQEIKQTKAGEGESELHFKIENDYKIPPSEDFLEKHTLWPELNKFYGHGYEISCVSTNHSGSLIVSACKSQTKDHSAILFYDPKTYAILDKIHFHNYTIQQLEFSHNDTFLASVSRDRSLALFKKHPNSNKYSPFFSCQPHARIIWSLAFTYDDAFIVTGARDNRFKIWKISDEKKLNNSNQNQNDNSQSQQTQENQDLVKFVAEKNFKKNPVTAVAFSKHKGKDEKTGQLYYLLAAGFESGLVELYKFFGNQENQENQTDQENLVLVGKYPQHFEHSNIIKRIKFRKTTDEVSNVFEIASCSSDHSMRLMEITVE